MKLRVADEIVTVFRLDEAAKMLKTAGVLLYRRVETVLLLFGSFKRPEMGDRMRERESSARGERGSEIVLRCEREHCVLVQLKVVSRSIADEAILQL